MEVIEYLEKYDEQVKDLLVDLQENIVQLDREGYNILTSEYRQKYFDKMMSEVKKYQGKVFLALEKDQVLGLIVGIINNENESTYDFVAPKRGRITELVISKKFRSRGIGTILLDQMEAYLKQVGCEGVLLDVFGYNEKALAFYIEKGYFTRSIELMKKLS